MIIPIINCLSCFFVEFCHFFAGLTQETRPTWYKFGSLPLKYTETSGSYKISWSCRFRQIQELGMMIRAIGLSGGS